MERVGIYKDLKVSYGEFTNALLRLGYRKVLQENATFYVNDEHDSVIRIGHRNTPDKMMMLALFAGEAYSMEMTGVLAHRDDIAKMIEQDRLAAASGGQNTPANAAA